MVKNHKRLFLNHLPTYLKKVTLFNCDLKGGGAERSCVELANKIADCNISVDLICAKQGGVYENEISPKVRFVLLNCHKTLFSIFKLRHYLKKFKPDAVLSFSNSSNIVLIIASKLTKHPFKIFISQRSIFSASWRQARSQLPFFWPFLCSKLYSLADGVIANSQVAATDLEQTLKISKNKIHVIHNFVDPEKIRQNVSKPFPDKIKSLIKKPYLLSVGRLNLCKDQLTLIEAFSLLNNKDINLVILGEGPEKTNIELAIEKKNLKKRVFLPGFDKNPFRWIARAEVLVHTSINDSCPNIILQALACRCKIVATDSLGDTSFLLGNGKFGQLVKPGDKFALAKAIEKALGSPKKENKLWLKNFNPKNILQKYLKVLFPKQINSIKTRS